jgi:hypothetical protein
VFEGSCRAVYAAMFTGEDLSTAFSGQTLSAGFSGGICFFLFGVLDQQAISAITIVNGLVAISSYSVLMYWVNPYKRLPWKAICACTTTSCYDRQEQLVNASRSSPNSPSKSPLHSLSAHGSSGGGRAKSGATSSLHTSEYHDTITSRGFSNDYEERGGVSLHEPLITHEEINKTHHSSSSNDER